MDRITIVDRQDKVVGEADRKFVYKAGLNHRLIRVLLFNTAGQVLLQWRSKEEDSFPETWDQSAGGHVDAGEVYEEAAYRELEEELGVSGIKLSHWKTYYTSGSFGGKHYNRFNGVFIGEYEGPLVLQEEEVAEVRWWGQTELQEKMKSDPQLFTPGLMKLWEEYRTENK